MDIVGGMYSGMIAVVIGLMAVHNAFDFRRRWLDRDGTPAGATPGAYLRFTLNERVQHGLLGGSFVTLAATGCALTGRGDGTRAPAGPREGGRAGPVSPSIGSSGAVEVARVRNDPRAAYVIVFHRPLGRTLPDARG